MFVYIIRRVLLMIPTLFGITLACFVIINLTPGSPIEQRLQAIRLGAQGGASGSTGGGGSIRGETGVSEEVVEALKKQYGFDKPLVTRYFIWVKNLAVLDFGESFKYEEPVIDLIVSKFPISLIFGLTSFFLTYLICIPLGVLKAIRNGAGFDKSSTFLLFIAYSIPPLMLGILLRTFFASATYFDWFPIGGIHSDNYYDFTTWEKVVDRVHHFILPLICYMIGSFTFLTLLMKNSMLDVIKLDYIRTAKAKGLSDKVVYMKHALRNSLIPIATGMSGILFVFFGGSLIIETIFNIDGMGLLGFTAVTARDYNVLMGLIFIQSLLSVVGRLMTDILYVMIDPRIDFS